MAKKKISKKQWFGILLTLTIADLFIPDPLPFIDEIILIFFTIRSYGRAYG